MKHYTIIYSDGLHVCAYTGDSNYPFYYGGEPYSFERREDAERIMQDIITAYPATRQSDFRIVEV